MIVDPGAHSRADSWKPLILPSLTPAAVDILMNRKVPFIRIPGFLSPEWCAEIIHRFERAMEEVPHQRGMRMGTMLFDSLAWPVEMFVDRDEFDEYFTHVADSTSRIRRLFAGGTDPLVTMRQVWSEAGWTEVPAEEDANRRYLPDAVWGIRDAWAPPHVDAFEHDRPTTLSRFQRRFNFNVYIQNPDEGGEFIVFNRYGTNDSDVPRGLDPELTAQLLGGVERIVHRPTPGDLVIFDAMLYHEVGAVQGAHNARIQEHCCILAEPATREFAFFV
jgi:hypothetical protein